MRNVWAIAWRDLRSLFTSPIAYVLLTGFELLAGWFFFNLLSQFNRMVAVYSGLRGYDTTWLNLNDAVVAPLLQNLSLVLIIVVPMLTMRSFAEERSAGTYELLFTSPVRVAEMVAGKFLAGLAMVTFMIALTLVFPAILFVYGNPEAGLVISGYLGLLAMAIAAIAIGNFTSALTSNQIIAAVSSLVILLLMFVINWPAEGAGETLKAVLLYLSVTEHFRMMVRGIIDTKDVVYFISLTSVFLFLTHRAVESARWR
ncbi:MAG: ABC transporter permease [Deltaproteobacteria bacterium]